MKKVVVYTSQTCPHCPPVKDYLTENNIPFENKDLSTDAAARKDLMKRGVMSVPTIIIDDTDIIVGFDKDKIDETFGL